MTYEPVFQYTTHKKFWKLTSIFGTKEIALTRGLENYYDYLNRKLKYPKERIYLTPEECRQIVSYPHYCLACGYQEEKEHLIGKNDNECLYCPLEVTPNILKSIAPMFRSDMRDACLCGLFEAFSYYSDRLLLMEDTISLRSEDIARIMNISCEFKISHNNISPDSKEERQSVDAFHKEYNRMRAGMYLTARTIANLPVKKGIKYI